MRHIHASLYNMGLCRHIFRLSGSFSYVVWPRNDPLFSPQFFVHFTRFLDSNGYGNCQYSRPSKAISSTTDAIPTTADDSLSTRDATYRTRESPQRWSSKIAQRFRLHFRLGGLPYLRRAKEDEDYQGTQ